MYRPPTQNLVPRGPLETLSPPALHWTQHTAEDPTVNRGTVRNSRNIIVNNPRRANSTARNRVVARVKREESTCWICKEEVDLTLGFQFGKHGAKCRKPDCRGCVPDPMRAEIDEVIPISRGGSPYDRKNCRLAHRICNQRRGNKIIGQLPPIGTLKTSREW